MKKLKSREFKQIMIYKLPPPKNPSWDIQDGLNAVMSLIAACGYLYHTPYLLCSTVNIVM